MAYMKDSTGRRLDTFEVTGRNPSNVATRLFGGRMSTITPGVAQTYQISTELAADFDAVRPIFANTGRFGFAMRAVAASVVGSEADLNNSAGTWAQGTRAGLTRIYAENSPGNGRVAYTTTDWIPLASIPRTDGGTKPLVIVRAYFPAYANLPVYGDGTDDFTNWATRNDGRIWASRAQAVEGVNNPANFTSTTNNSQSPIVGVQYLVRGKAVTVLATGASNTDGRGTYLGEGFAMPAIEDLTDAETTYEYANAGWAGQTRSIYTERTIDILGSEIRPDVLVLETGSGNDAPTTITTDIVNEFRAQRGRMIAEARRYGVPVVLWTWLPATEAVRPWGATDALRRAYNTECLELAGAGVVVVDAAAAVEGATTGSGQVELAPAYTTDGVHLNDAGNAAVADILKAGVVEASKQAAGNSRQPNSSRADAPVFLVTDTDAHVTKSGTWVYASSGAGSWTIPSVNPIKQNDSQAYEIQVRETAGPLTLTRTGGDTFQLGALSPSSIVVQPGQSVRLTPGNASSWCVAGLPTATIRRVKTDATAALSVTREFGLYVNTGAATTWTLPAVASNLGVEFTIKNRGTGAITLQRAGADNLYDTAAVTSVSIAAGASVTVVNDGTYWLKL